MNRVGFGKTDKQGLNAPSVTEPFAGSDNKLAGYLALLRAEVPRERRGESSSRRGSCVFRRK